MSINVTSSLIVAKARGADPEGVAAKKEGTCAFCGLHIGIGDMSSEFSVTDSFMDDLSLAARGSSMVCGYCPPLMTAAGIRETGYGLFTASGSKPFRKWKDIAEALTTPPNEPFVAVYATANNQHMAWRAPVNFSPELFYVRVGLRDLKIRHAVLMRAVAVSQEVANAFQIESTDKTLAHPFLRLSFDLTKIGHATLRLNSSKNSITPETRAELFKQYEEQIHFLRNLSLGETWGLLFLLTPGAGSK